MQVCVKGLAAVLSLSQLCWPENSREVGVGKGQEDPIKEQILICGDTAELNAALLSLSLCVSVSPSRERSLYSRCRVPGAFLPGFVTCLQADAVDNEVWSELSVQDNLNFLTFTPPTHPPPYFGAPFGPYIFKNQNAQNCCLTWEV